MDFKDLPWSYTLSELLNKYFEVLLWFWIYKFLEAYITRCHSHSDCIIYSSRYVPVKISRQVTDPHNITQANHAHKQYSGCFMHEQFTSTLPATEARRTQYDFGRPILIGQDQIVHQPICSVYSDVYRLSQPTTIQAVTT